MIAAFGMGAATVQAVADARARRRGVPRRGALRALNRGIPGFNAIARAALRSSRVASLIDEAVAELAECGRPARPESVLAAFFAISAVCGVICALGARSAVAGAAMIAGAWAVVLVLLSHRREVRREAVHDAVPGVLASLSSCFEAGFTLVQTFQQVARDAPDSLAPLFARAAHVLQTGGDAEEALGVVRRGAQTAELSFVAVALDVQHQSGGAIGKVIDSAVEAAQGEIDLRRALRVQTAQAKLSARVVSAMPFVLVAAFSVASPDFLAPFFASAAGYALLACAIAMQAAGIVLVRRALAVGGVS